MEKEDLIDGITNVASELISDGIIGIFKLLFKGVAFIGKEATKEKIFRDRLGKTLSGLTGEERKKFETFVTTVEKELKANGEKLKSMVKSRDAYDKIMLDERLGISPTYADGDKKYKSMLSELCHGVIDDTIKTFAERGDEKAKNAYVFSVVDAKLDDIQKALVELSERFGVTVSPEAFNAAAISAADKKRNGKQKYDGRIDTYEIAQEIQCGVCGAYNWGYDPNGTCVCLSCMSAFSVTEEKNAARKYSRSDLDELHSLIRDTNKTVHGIEGKVDDLTDKVDRLIEQIDEKDEKRQEAERQLEELRRKLKEENAAKLELEYQLEQLRQSGYDDTETFDKINDVSSMIDENKKTREELEADAESLSETIEAQLEEIERLQELLKEQRSEADFATLDELTVPVNATKKIAKLIASAKKGSAKAQYKLGMRYENGRGLKNDLRMAVSLFRISANNGYAKSQCELGFCYKNGTYVQKNYKRAVEYFELAASNGNDDAIRALGKCYERGEGVKRDPKRAFDCFRRSARLGNHNARKDLISCYRYGFGVEENKRRANAMGSADSIAAIIGYVVFLIGIITDLVLVLVSYFVFDINILFPSVSGIVFIALLSVSAVMWLSLVVCIISYIYVSGWKQKGWLFFIIPIAVFAGLTLWIGLGFDIKTYDLAKDGIVCNYNDDGTLAVCGGEAYLKNIEIPTEIDGHGVTTVADQAFFYNTKLESIVIPNGVTSIGFGAFYECNSLTNIVIPNGVTSIRYKTFYGCSGLTSIVIPSSVTQIVNEAFEGCDNLIEIENGVRYVDDWVIGCDQDITDVTLRPNTAGIAWRAFDDCDNITTATIPTTVISEIPKTNLQTVNINGGSSIGNSAFYNCSGLTSITIPNSVTSIGMLAFFGCSSLTSIVIPDSVTVIGSSAFNNLTIYCEASEKPDGWDNYWNSRCTVVWGYEG